MKKYYKKLYRCAFVSSSLSSFEFEIIDFLKAIQSSRSCQELFYGDNNYDNINNNNSGTNNINNNYY